MWPPLITVYLYFMVLLPAGGIVWSIDGSPRRQLYQYPVPLITWPDLFSRHFVREEHKNETTQIELFLNSVPILSLLNREEKLRLVDGLNKVLFRPGMTVIRQGDPGDFFYIIKEGEAVVYQDTQQGKRKVNHLFKADFFGERALLCDEPRWTGQFRLLLEVAHLKCWSCTLHLLAFVHSQQLLMIGNTCLCCSIFRERCVWECVTFVFQQPAAN